MFGVKKVFGSNKSEADQSAAPKVKKNKDGYFLQLDESEDTQPAASETTAEAKPVEEKKPQPVQIAAPVEEKQPEPAQAAPVEEKKPEAVKAKSTKKKKKTSVKAASAPSKVPDSMNSKSNSNNGKNVEPQSEMTFAPKYLMPTATTRRRPGPSMNMFREMVRSGNTPKA
ncbi:MAG: hypothetical protein AB4426_15900 [Xenococcaceae cyanobacterium]